MIDLIPAFIYAKDIGSRFIAMNAALARNMGTTSEQAIGKTDFDFFPRDLAEKFYRRRTGADQVRHRHHRARGTRASTRSPASRARCVTSKVPLRDENGMVIGIIGLGFDITERKRAEQRLARANVSSPSAASPPASRMKSTRLSSI